MFISAKEPLIIGALVRKLTCKDEASDVSFSNVAFDFVYRVVKMNRMHYLYRSFSAEEPYN